MCPRSGPTCKRALNRVGESSSGRGSAGRAVGRAGRPRQRDRIFADRTGMCGQISATIPRTQITRLFNRFFYSFTTKFTFKLRNALRECKFAAFFQLFCIPKFQFRLLRSAHFPSRLHVRELPSHRASLSPASSLPSLRPLLVTTSAAPLSFPLLSLALSKYAWKRSEERAFLEHAGRTAARRPRRPLSPSSLCLPRRVQARLSPSSRSRSRSLSLSPSVVFAASRRIQQHA